MDVAIRCICPGEEVRHPDGDTVTLPEILSFRQTLAVRQYVAQERKGDEDLAGFIALLIEAYLYQCVGDWTIVDDKGKPLPVSKAAVHTLFMTPANLDVAEKVGDAADRLYSDKVFLPLMHGASSSSPVTPIDGSTSQTNGSAPQRKQSKRSSTSTTPMVVTGPMAASPGGASSSSQN